ncbi:MAG TPA: hypothetical protein VMM13_18770, partial [Euzebya sp.]|nr:hypothetical protein [Euzebya sp.]
TDAMFTSAMIDTLAGIFDRVVEDGLLPEEEVRRHQADFLHQFILGGTWRRLRVRDVAGAHEVMRLFGHPAVRAARWSRRWAAVRLAFGVITAVPLRGQA